MTRLIPRTGEDHAKTAAAEAPAGRPAPGRAISGIRSFARNSSGNVALLFGIAALPLFAAMGLALDYSYAVRERTDLQNAIDAAAISLAKMPKTTTDAVMKEKAEKFVAAIMPDSRSSNFDIDVTRDKNSLTVTASADYPTLLVRVLNLLTNDESASTMRIETQSVAKWGGGRVEVALALDNTLSMKSSNKMTELKKAVKAMIDDIEAAVVEEDDARIAIIPFNTVVKIGTGYKNESWLDKTVYYKPDSNNKNSNKLPKESTWTGCVTDRDPQNDVKDTVPTTSASTKFPAAVCPEQGKITEMITLSTDWDTLRSRVDKMVPDGYTNVTIGLEWAWHVLSKNAPITDGSDPTVKTENPITKYIVLLTDGDNTANRKYPYDPEDIDKNAPAIDARTKLACTNAKAAGIKIFAVRVIEGNASLLQDCSSDSKTMYFDVDNADQIGVVFDNITSTIVKLHLAH